MENNPSIIPNSMRNPSKEFPYIGESVDLYDKRKGKNQEQVNKETDDTFTFHQSEINALNSQNYVTVSTYSSLPEEGSVDTIYRVSFWDGSANSGAGDTDATVYSEYAWDGIHNEYKLLAVRTAIGEVFDISLWKAVGGILATFEDLADALGTNGENIPDGVKRGGMRVQFVQSSDNKYVQYRYMGTATTGSPNPFLDTANWQGVDEKPTLNSKNLAESDGVFKYCSTEEEVNFTGYELLAGWINADGIRITREGAYHYAIPVSCDYIRIVPKDDVVAVVTFASSVSSNGNWVLCSGITRYVIESESSIQVPVNANYIIVGQAGTNNGVDYTPKHLFLTSSFKQVINSLDDKIDTKVTPFFSHGTLDFYSNENKITWKEGLVLIYNDSPVSIPANTEGITFTRARFVFVVYDKTNNTITTKNIQTTDGSFVIAVLLYSLSNYHLERVGFSVLPYTIDGIEYGRTIPQQDATAAIDMFKHLYANTYNLNDYLSVYGWVENNGSLGNHTGALHKEIPVVGGMELEITGGENNSFVVFAESIYCGDWTKIGSRVSINANETVTLTAPSNARYLIVGERNDDSVAIGYYLPTNIKLKKEETPIPELGFKCNPRVEGSTDLNDYDEVGWYQLSSSVIYTHSPLSTAQASMLVNYDFNDNAVYRVQELYDLSRGIVWFRIRSVDGSWKSWKKYSSSSGVANNTNYSFTNSSLSNQGENKGENISIMSYNVAMYNDDTATYVSDEKLLNLRKVLNDVNPDIIGVQEDRKYIDSSNSKTSLAYLFNPVYPFQYSSPMLDDAAELGTYIHSKIQAVSNGGLFYSNYATRPKIEYATYAIGNKTLLFISTHLVANAGDSASSQASIAKRVENFAELFGWVNGTLDLKDIDNNDVHCPTYDWCIITGDMNTITDTDKTNLATAASNANFILGNGGRLGWLQTALRYSGSMTSLDNIIVSNNVIINSFTSYTEWYDRLYSDHVPVMANLTLLDT